MSNFLKTSVLFFLFTLCANLNAQTAADEQAVRNTIIKAMEDYYAADADKLASYYAENAVVIEYTGQKVVGREAIRKSLTEAFKVEKPTASSIQLSVSSVRFLNAGTALVVADLKGSAQVEGNTIEWTGISSMVMSRTGGKWLVEQEQNTPIMPEQSK